MSYFVHPVPEYEQNLDKLFCIAFDANHPAMRDYALMKMELKRLCAAQFTLSAFGIRNDQNFWCAIFNDKTLAENIVSRGQPSHNEKVFPLYTKGE